jgi:P27 family predicted phage terminase small subunit
VSRKPLPGPPTGISARAKRLFRAVVRDYELSDAEVELLRCACEALDRADAAAKIVRAEGLTVLDRYGSPKTHPAVDVEARSRALFARFVGQLGVKLPPTEDIGSVRARQAAGARWQRQARRAR